MNVTLTPDLEHALVQRARRHGTTPEAVVLDAIREKLGLEPAETAKILEPRDEWEKRLLRIGTPCAAQRHHARLRSPAKISRELSAATLRGPGIDSRQSPAPPAHRPALTCVPQRQARPEHRTGR